ncbi:hypothetical protein [Halopiger xanaduensis]|uniref:Uncharacterized protein n=1 Tax=Halopiger xanaduensis (strain DSM 18323 / JCM 14033 / SH-6) TaxID=797210 RepID=F8D677_HALXS|nr:hypothetical protein [Halopiger xanaduensis]AEH35596.1 hypothetical protein Halxa_0960 [Halopiger xanaduensis SH-6]
MEIVHDPSLDPREPREGDLEVFEGLEPGDSVKFFEWPVEPLTVLGWEDDENVGERLRVKAEGSESFLYRVEDHLWHYVPEEDTTKSIIRSQFRISCWSSPRKPELTN